MKDTCEDHLRGALTKALYMRGPLAVTPRGHHDRGIVASGTLHLGGTVAIAASLLAV